MKQTKLLVTTLIAIGLTNAQSASEKEGKRKRPPLTASIIAEIDTDGDGSVSKEEREAARDSIKDIILSQYDADGDGELSARHVKLEVKKGLVANVISKVSLGSAAINTRQKPFAFLFII